VFSGCALSLRCPQTKTRLDTMLHCKSFQTPSDKQRACFKRLDQCFWVMSRDLQLETAYVRSGTIAKFSTGKSRIVSRLTIQRVSGSHILMSYEPTQYWYLRDPRFKANPLVLSDETKLIHHFSAYFPCWMVSVIGTLTLVDSRPSKCQDGSKWLDFQNPQANRILQRYECEVFHDFLKSFLIVFLPFEYIDYWKLWTWAVVAAILPPTIFSPIFYSVPFDTVSKWSSYGEILR
jgi:hypothetical protein